MDNMFKKCPFCGKELPVDEFFCPYCVHRLDEEVAVKEDVPHKKHRRFIAIIAGVIVIASVLLISITGIIIKSHKKSDNTFTQSDVYNDYSYGMMYGNISQIENTNRYTDSQKNIIEYYDNNYMNLFSYEFLIRYPDIFENMQVKFEAVVEKVVKTDKDSFILLVSWNQTYNRLQEDKWNSCIMLEGKLDDISVAGSSSNGTHVVEGDRIYVYAEFLTLENYTIDQNIYNIPKCLANRVILNDVNTDMQEKFSKDYLKAYADYLFGTEVSVREAVYEKDFIFDSLHYPEYAFMICEFDNISDEEAYEIYQNGGLIRKSGSTADNDTIIRAAADGKHFYRIEYNKSYKHIRISYYSDVNNCIWSRGFDDSSFLRYDYTINNIYIATDNSLYVINNQNGENVYNPVTVDSCNGLIKCLDGVVFYYNETGIFEKYDLKGNPVWKSNVTDDKIQVSNIQFTDDKMTLHLYVGDEYTDIMTVINLDNGEILNSVHSLEKNRYHSICR